MDETFWDERYRSAKRIWSGNPNPQLVSEASQLSPGRALDVGAGEGADAIWLAERGFHVTAVDFSSVALERARLHAEQRSPEVAGRITFLHADLTRWSPPEASFDLVSVQFLHMPSAVRAPIYQRLARAVARGGVLLIVGHHPSDLTTRVQRPREPDLFFTAEELAESLPTDAWTILAKDTRPRAAVDADGQAATVHDTVLVARRR